MNAEWIEQSGGSGPANGPGRLHDFEARLGHRTRVPTERLHEILAMRHDSLRVEIQQVTRILKRFAEAVVESWERPEAADRFVASLDLKAISRDHDWRAIFSTMRGQEGNCVEYKRAVLVRYLQYLGFRKRLVEYVYARRQGLADTDAFTDVTQLPRSQAAGADGRDLDDFVRLPLGETLEFRLEEGQRVDLMLGPHLFRLVGARPPCLMDQNGVMSFLKPGRNMVGRHPESDIVVDGSFGNVSRAHMIIEWEEPDRVRLLDLSSRGSWMRRSVLGRARSKPS